MQARFRTNQKFVSDSYLSHDKLMPAGVALILGWTLAGAAFVTSLWILPYNLAAGLLMLLADCIFVVRLCVQTDHLTMQSSYRYEFVLTDKEAILYTFDEADRRHLIQGVPLEAVSVAELFVVQEISNLTLISPGCNLEIPLWTFGNSRSKITGALRQRGISIVNLQNEVIELHGLRDAA